jgi:hydrogenase/urease accessory protein HupE
MELPFGTAMKQFFLLGTEHIWFGPDHLMFLIALILLGGRFIDILKIVTSFTVAHSVTLILASLEIISLPGAFVEAIVALSILYMAIENLFVKTTTYRWALTFAFGLIHGFGFAGSLAEIQIPHNHFISSLLIFNLGVEVAQMAVVAVLLPVIIYLKRFNWNIWFVRATTGTIAAFGLNWFVSRTVGIELLPFLSI